MCPGLAFTEDVLEEEREGDEGCAGALYIPNGVIVDARDIYRRSGTRASYRVARRAGTRARLRISKVERVKDLFEEFDQVALCCGAAVASLFDYEKIPIQLQGGHVLELKPKGLDVAYWYDVRRASGNRARDGGSDEGIRRRARGLFSSRRRRRRRRPSRRGRSRAAPRARRQSVPTHRRLGRITREIRRSRQPPRTPLGALPPPVPRVDDETSAWFLAGLGARGLVYHGILGRWMANAILDDDVSRIPEDVRRVC